MMTLYSVYLSKYTMQSPYVSNYFPAECDDVFHGTNVNVLFCCYLIIYLILYTRLLILAHHICRQGAMFASLTS